MSGIAPDHAFAIDVHTRRYPSMMLSRHDFYAIAGVHSYGKPHITDTRSYGVLDTLLNYHKRLFMC